MIIEFLLTSIAAFGILTILAYLKQFEEGIAELQGKSDILFCQTCNDLHKSGRECKNIKGGLTKLKTYCTRKRKATFGYTRRSK